MSKRWDEAIEAAVKAMAGDGPYAFLFESNPNNRVCLESAIEAFATAAHGPSGPAAIKDWVEGRAVLVPQYGSRSIAIQNVLEQINGADFTVADLITKLPSMSRKQVYNAVGYLSRHGQVSRTGYGTYAASPAAPDGETK